MLRILQQTWSEFSEDNCSRLAAALAYYTVFSIAPLIVIVTWIISLFFEPAQVQQFVQNELQAMIGGGGADQIMTMTSKAEQAGGGIIGGVIGIGALLLGATGVVVQLQDALNTAWDVTPDPAQGGGVKAFIVKRIFSFAMVLAIGFILLVSLILSTMLAALSDVLGNVLPGGAEGWLLQLVNFAASFGVVTLLFAAMFKLLPEAEVRWKNVWVGAAVTALLFTLGKLLLGWYLGSADVGSAYGAAGSLVLVLLWVYYSSLILLFGAEFTQVWAGSRGEPLHPKEGAVSLDQRHTPESGGHELHLH